MSLKFGILGLLTYEDMSGYDINKLFKNSLEFFWKAHQSQIYRELDKLKEKGLVESQIVKQQDKPDKKLFSITEAGKEKLVNWVNEYFVKDEFKTRNSFLMRIFFSSLGDEEKLQKGLKEYIKFNKAYLQDIKETEEKVVKDKTVSNDNPQVYWYMTMKKGYYECKANIEWAEDILKMIKAKG